MYCAAASPPDGGRKAAAGIDYLPDDGYGEFVGQFTAAS